VVASRPAGRTPLTAGHNYCPQGHSLITNDDYRQSVMTLRKFEVVGAAGLSEPMYCLGGGGGGGAFCGELVSKLHCADNRLQLYCYLNLVSHANGGIIKD
jgi:hypothetical protein